MSATQPTTRGATNPKIIYAVTLNFSVLQAMCSAVSRWWQSKPFSYVWSWTSFGGGPGWNSVPSWSCSKAVYKPVWHIPLLSVQWINSWWWTDELFETCRVSCQNKFVKLVHLVGFIIKKFVKMHSHMNVKNWDAILQNHYILHCVKILHKV